MAGGAGGANPTHRRQPVSVQQSESVTQLSGPDVATPSGPFEPSNTVPSMVSWSYPLSVLKLEALTSPYPDKVMVHCSPLP